MAVSNSDYSNDEIGVQWLEHFDKYTRKKRKGALRMFIMDGASSHTNEEFVRVCYRKNILPFRLPLHTTHLLQPLDVVCFQPLKHYHSEAIDDAVRDGDYEFSKLEFLARITTIRSQAFKKNTIRESFRKTGLIPFNPEIVMQKLQDLSPSNTEPNLPSTPRTPTRVTRETFFTTPTTIRAFTLHASALTNTEYSPSSRKIMQEKYVKGTLAKVNSGKLAEDQLKKVRTAELERASRRKLGNRVVQKGGVITVGKAREKIADRRANELAIAQRALVRAEKAAHNAIVGPWLSMFKEGSKVKNTFKQDNKAKRVVLAGLFRELKMFVKKGKSGDVPLAETVSWQALHRRCSDFCRM